MGFLPDLLDSMICSMSRASYFGSSMSIPGKTERRMPSAFWSRCSKASMYWGAGFRLLLDGWSYVHSESYQYCKGKDKSD